MRILIADDDATSRLMLEAIASRLGHECVSVTDGTAAWDALASSGFDVLLSDWMMPGTDGPELCRRVRHELDARYVYVVLITALGNHEQVLAGMTSGADDYLVKPVDPFSLETRLVAAERVTTLHRRLVEVQDALSKATAEATERSLTDALTGLSNRRRMEEDLADMHAMAQRHLRSYGVVLLDIDHFKAYNDHYGHQRGDEVLRRVAQSLVSVARWGERVYRYGGEEFLVLLDDCTDEGAAAAAERLRREVAALDIPHEFRTDPPPMVTLSGGVACWYPTSPRLLAEVLGEADRGLFDAKPCGRNRIRAAGSPVGAR